MTRHTYIIGDLQGCYGAFVNLLQKIEFDATQDKIYLCGDIVARGEDSLATLRLAKQLADQNALQTVLGNHDITLIATWLGVLPIKPKDGTAPIFEASDGDELLHWLRVQPFLLEPNPQSIVVHAGIAPHWTTDTAKACAKELQIQFSGSIKQLKRLLPNLYSKTPKLWSDDSLGFERLCMISDYFTRMRLCDKDCRLDLQFKAGLDDTMPAGFRPWFEWQSPSSERVFFGHWAALEGKVDTPKVRSLDAGCVWGGKLLAYRLEDNKVFGVNNPNFKSKS